MNKKYRLFGKIPVVDILILVMIAAVLVLAIKFVTKEEVQVETGTEAQATPESYPFTATFLVKNVADSTADLFKEGDKLYLADGCYAGTVTKVQVEQRVEYGFDADGNTVISKPEGRNNVLVTVDGIADKKTKKVMSINKKMISYGRSITWGNDKYFVEMTPVDIERGSK